MKRAIHKHRNYVARKLTCGVSAFDILKKTLPKQRGCDSFSHYERNYVFIFNTVPTQLQKN